MVDILRIVIIIAICLVLYRILLKLKSDNFKEGYSKGYADGLLHGKDSVVKETEVFLQTEWTATDKELVYSTADDDIYAPDTDDWSPLIPQATKQKLVDGITAYNRASDRKRTTKKF